MRRAAFPDATYSFTLPDGGRGVLYPGSRIETNERDVPLPGEDVLFLVGTVYAGSLYMAGQGHQSGQCWLYGPRGWKPLGPTFGVSPCAFGGGWLYFVSSQNGYTVLHIATGERHEVPASLGSQGIRYIENGQPVSGDATYRDGELFEYTRHGEVVVGQGHEGGALINGRLLEPGDCRFIRFEREGDQLAVAIVKQAERRAVLHWLTVADIPLLPMPDVDPPPPPEKKMRLPDDVHATFVAMVQKFPHDGTDDDRRAAMRKAVQTIRARHGLRYVWKTEHADLSSPSKDGMGYAPEGDVVNGQLVRMFIWDMINGTTHQPNAAGDSEPLREAYALTPEPKDWLTGEDPPPPPPPDDLIKLRAEVATLKADLAALRTRVTACEMENEAQDDDIARLLQRVLAWESKPLPKLRVKGGTSRTFAHAHAIDLEVVPE